MAHKAIIHDGHDWLESVTEEILEPDRPIIDPHHHLWRARGAGDYLLPELWRDTGSGHNIRQTVFIECHAEYRDHGPSHLRPVGETEFVAAIAAASRQDDSQATITGIVAHADLRLPLAQLDAVLDAHEVASEGLFRGIRHAGACEDNPEFLLIKPRQPKGLYQDPDFRRGLAHLGKRGLSYDTWHYHHQNRDFLELARAVPETTMVLDHFGTPLGVGPYAGRRQEIFSQWREDIAEIARCPNVYAKLGGLAMPDNGFGWNLRVTPPGSDEFVSAQQDYYHHTLDCFGADRCMFESNFPVDKWSLSYHVVWNGFKKLAANYSEDEKSRLFYHTAAEVYRLT